MKRFGRNQKRKLKLELESAKITLRHANNYIDELLHKPTVNNWKQVYIHPEALGLVRDASTPVHQMRVMEEKLHHLELDLEEHMPYLKDERDPKMFHIKFKLDNGQQTYAISASALRQMDVEQLKHYITAQMADMIITTLRRNK